MIDFFLTSILVFVILVIFGVLGYAAYQVLELIRND